MSRVELSGIIAQGPEFRDLKSGGVVSTLQVQFAAAISRAVITVFAGAEWTPTMREVGVGDSIFVKGHLFLAAGVVGIMADFISVPRQPEWPA